jgi:type VI secretion system protein ImpF
MVAIDDKKRLIAPILDRLKGDNNSAIQSHQVLKQLRESVRSDLEHLFNTRYRRLSPPEHLENLKASLINFGLPDISTINLTNKDSRQHFCQEVEDAILTFEPRIRTVRVFGEQNPSADDPIIRFRIEATLHANPAAETIIFDSALNPVTHNINVADVG